MDGSGYLFTKDVPAKWQIIICQRFILATKREHRARQMASLTFQSLTSTRWRDVAPLIVLVAHRVVDVALLLDMLELLVILHCLL